MAKTKKPNLRREGYTRQWNVETVKALKEHQVLRRWNKTVPKIDDRNGVQMFAFMYSTNGVDGWHLVGGPCREIVEMERQEMIRHTSPRSKYPKFTTVRPIRFCP